MAHQTVFCAIRCSLGFEMHQIRPTATKSTFFFSFAPNFTFAWKPTLVPNRSQLSCHCVICTYAAFWGGARRSLVYVQHHPEIPPTATEDLQKDEGGTREGTRDLGRNPVCLRGHMRDRAEVAGYCLQVDWRDKQRANCHSHSRAVSVSRWMLERRQVAARW